MWNNPEFIISLSQKWTSSFFRCFCKLVSSRSVKLILWFPAQPFRKRPNYDVCCQQTVSIQQSRKYWAKFWSVIDSCISRQLKIIFSWIKLKTVACVWSGFCCPVVLCHLIIFYQKIRKVILRIGRCRKSFVSRWLTRQQRRKNLQIFQLHSW